MLNFYVMDGKKLIDFKPKWINYARAFDRKCKMAGLWENMTIQESKSAYPDDFKKNLYLLIKLKGKSDCKSLKRGDSDFVTKEFYIIEVICAMVGTLTPREFMNMFPIEKTFDGEKYQWKDYFYTRNYIEKFGMDKLIGDKAPEFLMEYQNLDITHFMVYWMEVVSQMNILQGGKDILLEFMEEQGVKPHTMHSDGNYMIDDETGEKFEIKSPKKKMKKLFSIT